MIEALFGSKTRVKLLHLFLNNPGKSFYVREITRLIDEQINSVRRELSNMTNVGIVASKNSDNKLYYQVNQKYEYYKPLRSIFSDVPLEDESETVVEEAPVQTFSWIKTLEKLRGLRLAIVSGPMLHNKATQVDLLLAGTLQDAEVTKLIQAIEKAEGREINYVVLGYDDFYYRLSVRDQFITGIIHTEHSVILDKEHVFNK